MKKGQLIQTEYQVFTDDQTGATIHQLTRHPSTSHGLFGVLYPSFRPGTGSDHPQVALVAHRNGFPQLCLFDFATKTAKVLTDDEGLQSFSPSFSPDREYLYFSTKQGHIRRVHVDSLVDETVFAQPNGNLGDCSLSHDGRYVVTCCKQESAFGLLVVDIGDRSGRIVFETDLQILHPQFHPNDANLIVYAGNPNPRLWMIHRDGTNSQCLYKNAWNEFVVHESFLGDSDDLIFTVWPYRLVRFSIHERRLRTIADINAWHMASNREGTLIVSDTNHPDRGLLLIDPESGQFETLCYPGASCHGSQWKHDHPATAEAWTARPDGEIDARVLSWMEMKVDTVYGPQWTHPHPSFDDSGRWIAYTSDVSGESQVYVVQVPPHSVPGH